MAWTEMEWPDDLQCLMVFSTTGAFSVVVMMITCSCLDAKRQAISESGTKWPGVIYGITIISRGVDDSCELTAIFLQAC